MVKGKPSFIIDIFEFYNIYFETSQLSLPSSDQINCLLKLFEIQVTILITVKNAKDHVRHCLAHLHVRKERLKLKSGK